MVLFLLAMNQSVFSLTRQFTGKLDENGKASVNFVIEQSKVHFLQAFVLYQKSYRPVKVFYNESIIFIDLGPSFKGLPYRINYWAP